MAVALEFRDLALRLDRNEFEPFSLSISEGEKVAIFFKTDYFDKALLNLLTFSEVGYSGSVSLYGKDYAAFNDDDIRQFRTKINFVSLELPLLNTLSLIENVYLPLFYLYNVREGEAFDRAYEVLKILGIHGRYKTFPANLSPFEKKIGLFARMWLMDPDIVYYSHIFGNLDRLKKAQVAGLIERFHYQKKGRISLFSTHFFSEIHDLSAVRIDKVANV